MAHACNILYTIPDFFPAVLEAGSSGIAVARCTVIHTTEVLSLATTGALNLGVYTHIRRSSGLYQNRAVSGNKLVETATLACL